MVKAIIMAEINAKVFVKARGLNSFPSGPSIANTGRKPITVVDTAVKTAPPTSFVATKTLSNKLSLLFGSDICLIMFSTITIPISTSVPMAMAIPDRETIFASTLNTFIAIKVIITARGRRPEIKSELLKCITIRRTTIMVTKISSVKADFKVPRVSYINPLLS